MAKIRKQQQGLFADAYSKLETSEYLPLKEIINTKLIQREELDRCITCFIDSKNPDNQLLYKKSTQEQIHQFLESINSVLGNANAA